MTHTRIVTPVDSEHIRDVVSDHGGDNIELDVIRLKSGHVIAINGEVAILFPSFKSYIDPDTDASDFPTFVLYDEPEERELGEEEEGKERCTNCGDRLEPMQIGLCDDCIPF